MLVYTCVLKSFLSLLVICNRIQIADTSPLRKWLTAADLRQLLLNEMMNTSGDPSTRNTTIPPIRTLTSQTFGPSKDVITTTISTTTTTTTTTASAAVTTVSIGQFDFPALTATSTTLMTATSTKPATVTSMFEFEYFPTNHAEPNLFETTPPPLLSYDMFDSQEKPTQDTAMFKNEKDSEPSTTTMTTTTTTITTTTTTTQPLSEPEAGMNDLHVKPSTQDITYKDVKDSSASASVKRLTSKTKYVAQEFISFTKTTSHLLNFAKICIGISPFICMCLLYVIKK